MKIEHLSKTFHQHKVLDDICIEVNKGDVVALIGSSGAGKSTFLRTINYMEKADSGQMTLGDKQYDFAAIHKTDILELRQRTAMVFQQFNLFQRKTALENVMEGLVVVKKMTKQQAETIALAQLEKVGLLDRKNYYPKHLSGGQQQRVALARALAMSPEILLLDEPTSALDPELVAEVLKAVKNAANEGQTMILVSHEMDFVYDVATKVCFLEQGKILESGTPQEVFYHPKNERTKEFLTGVKRLYEPEYVI